MRALVATGIVALLAACGGGGGDSGSPTPTPPATQAQVLIEAYGDSTVKGCTAQTGAPATADCPVAGYILTPHNGPATLQYLLQQQFGGMVSVQNMGVAGTTLADLLNGTNNVPMTWAQQMAQSKAQIVMIMDGINDAYRTETTPPVFSHQLIETVKTARAAGKIVILETSNPLNNDHAADLAALMAAEISTATALGVPIVDNFYRMLARSDWASLLSDGMHPTPAGYEMAGQNTYATVAPIVQSLLSAGPVIETYGDSTKYGVTYTSGEWVQNPLNAPAYLQGLVGPSAAVSNQGAPFSDGAMLLNGTDGVHSAWPLQMQQSKARIVVINHGINDAGLNQETTVDYQFVLEQLISIARSAGKQVVLEEPSPRCDDPAKSAKLDQFVATMDWVAQSQNVPLISNYAYIKSLPDWQAMAPDCVHPNSTLYQIIAKREADVITPLLH